MYDIDPSMAVNAAAHQDIQARRRQVESLSRTGDEAERQAKMREACEGFEAIFIQKMWEQMRATLPKEGLMKSKEEEYWQSLYDQELGRSMASAGGIGLADMMMVQLNRNNQEMSDATRDSTMRRPALQVNPAPLLPPSVPGDRKADGAAVKEAPATGAAFSDAMSIYDGEARPDAPLEASPDMDPDVAAAGENSDPAATVAADDTPPSVRQILDELSRQTGAGSDPVQAPIITHVTYQTNLPLNQRKAAPLDQQGRRSAPRPLGGPIGTPAASVSPSTLPTGGSAPSPMTAAPTAAPGVPETATSEAGQKDEAPRHDILAGIRPRFIPDRFRSDRRQRGSAETLTAAVSVPRSSFSLPGQERPTRAGGPSLTAPEDVAEPVSLGNPAPPRGSLNAPVSGEMSSGFGWRIDPFTGQRAWHAGVDIRAEPGEGVRAALDGVVSFAGTHPELGNLVVVDHGDGLRTFYGHNSSLEVAVGQKVSAGMELAQAGSSGRAAGPHVHFEVRRGELALNPEPLLRQGTTRVASAR